MRLRISLISLTLSLIGQGTLGDPRSCDGQVRHLHLAVGHDPSREMTISFASGRSSNEAIAPIGCILIGTDPNTFDRLVLEQESPLKYDTTIEHEHHPFEEYSSPFQHHISVGGLEPGTRYYYKAIIGDREEGSEKLAARFSDTELEFGLRLAEEKEEIEREGRESEGQLRARRRLGPPPYNGSNKTCIDGNKVRSFTTAPPSGISPVSFAITGDLGQFEHSKETLIHMSRHRHNIDAVLLVGDISYANGKHGHWDTFFDFLDDYSIFDEVPLLVATGNHDIEKQEHGGEIFQAYEARFRMPQVRPAEFGIYNHTGKLDMEAPPYPLPYDWGNAFYSFSYGPAKHIVVSAYSSMDPDSAQYTWLKTELESIDRSVTPWVLISLHTPLYNSYAVHMHDPQIIAAREHFEPLFVKHHVNVVFTGHIHAYQRTKNVAMGKPHRRGPLHVTVGAGGRQCDAPFKSDSPEEWIVKRDASIYGYGKFSVFNETHAEWRWVPLSSSVATWMDLRNSIFGGEWQEPRRAC
eukprot:scaffold2644_cov129-Cylindrotheca_fusiformis.AAC.10